MGDLDAWGVPTGMSKPTGLPNTTSVSEILSVSYSPQLPFCFWPTLVRDLKHFEKSQKLQISVPFANGSALPPVYDTSSLLATSPSYPIVLGSIPTATSSSLLPLQSLSTSIATAIRLVIFKNISGGM
uniref:Uncharacterized protein n=1 Tax=Nelumbo nucifera TaxID=4432 RepID=A0A822XGN9_NELNU|nr:TPA_asm: hypothetical protein HUJ06_019458 [Nelumbo nucifera]